MQTLLPFLVYMLMSGAIRWEDAEGEEEEEEAVVVHQEEEEEEDGDAYAGALMVRCRSKGGGRLRGLNRGGGGAGRWRRWPKKEKMLPTLPLQYGRKVRRDLK